MTKHSSDVIDEKSNSPSKKMKKEISGPNILITGTPGVGKSNLCRALLEEDPDGIQWINIGAFAKENNYLGIQCNIVETQIPCFRNFPFFRFR